MRGLLRIINLSFTWNDRLVNLLWNICSTNNVFVEYHKPQSFIFKILSTWNIYKSTRFETKNDAPKKGHDSCPYEFTDIILITKMSLKLQFKH